MKLLNDAGGIAHLFGYPVPCVDPSVFKQAQASLAKFDKPSSVADFGVVQSGLETEETKRNLRGADLRELKLFYNEKDPKGVFADMCRVCNPETGKACWTTTAGKHWLIMKSKQQTDTALNSSDVTSSSVHAQVPDKKSASHVAPSNPAITPIESTVVAKTVAPVFSPSRNQTTKSSTVAAGQGERRHQSPIQNSLGSTSATGADSFSVQSPMHRQSIQNPLDTWLKVEVKIRDPELVRMYVTALTGPDDFDDFGDLVRAFLNNQVDLVRLVRLKIHRKHAVRMIDALEGRKAEVLQQLHSLVVALPNQPNRNVASASAYGVSYQSANSSGKGESGSASGESNAVFSSNNGRFRSIPSQSSKLVREKETSSCIIL